MGALARARAFAARFGLRAPVLLAPMAGACPPALSVAVARGGGMGACGAVTLSPQALREWAAAVRAAGGRDARFQVNLWVPDPPPVRDASHEARVCVFMSGFGPPPPPDAGDAAPPDFAAQCAALIDVAPAAASSVMGLFPPAVAAALAAARIPWLATATTVAEAVAAEAAGADAIIVQGVEAGGHRGTADAGAAEATAAGLIALLPAVADAVRVPLVAAGGIADGRGVAAALLLGASAVTVGTAYLRCPEAGVPRAWVAALAAAPPDGTRLTRAFSGRPGRALVTRFVEAAAAPGAPAPAPYPVQRGLTRALRDAAAAAGDDVGCMQAWAGQGAGLARAAEPAEALTKRLWAEAEAALSAASN